MDSGSESRQLAHQMMPFNRQAQIKRELPPDPDRPSVSYEADLQLIHDDDYFRVITMLECVDELLVVIVFVPIFF